PEPPDRRGGVGHHAQQRLRPEGRGVAPDSSEEEYGRRLREPEPRRRGGGRPARHHPGVVPDEDLPAESRGGGRAGAPALPGDRPQPPADRAPRPGDSEAPVLLRFAPRPATPEPGPRTGGAELRGNGRSPSGGPGHRAHGRPRGGLARRVAQGARPRRGGGGLAAALREGGGPMAEHIIPTSRR